ncbi:MAG: sugar ABC transporter permease [Oscillospiraceae bacterium]|nr:sugar ABC transporter permease [Oscillospiraceae bacterium]
MKKTLKKNSYERSRSINGILFVLPWIIGFAVFFIRPIIQSFLYSFADVTIVNGVQKDYTGFSQYRELFVKDTDFLPALFESFKQLISNVPLILALSLFIALLLNQEFRGRAFARAVFFLPVIVASGIILTLFSQDSYASGMMTENTQTALFGAYGLEALLNGMNLPSNVITTLTSVVNNIFNIVWQSGIQILLFLSGLQAIPGSYYEAASIEGSNAWLAFWKITFPTLMPTLLVAIVYSVVDSFTYYANPVIKLIQSTYLGNMRFGYASTMSWIYFLCIIVVLGLVFLFIGRQVKYRA